MSAVQSPLRTVEEAAEYLRCSQEKVRSYIAEGKLKSYRPDGRGKRRKLFIHVAELDRHIAACTLDGPTTPAPAPGAPAPKGREALRLAGWDGDDHRTGKAGRPKAKAQP